MFITSIALPLLITSFAAVASPPIPLPFSKFCFESTHQLLGTAMPVKITGTQTKAGIQSLSVEAFDQTYDISESCIAKFKGTEFNGCWVFVEYSDFGPELFVWFVQGHAAGTHSRQLLRIRKSGQVEVSNSITGPFVIERKTVPMRSLKHEFPPFVGK